MNRVPYLSIVVSAGRTGSRFVGHNLQHWVANCRSWHEPDVIDLHHPELLSKIQRFGVRYMTVDRLRGHSGIRHLSEQWSAGRLQHHEALSRLHAARGTLFGYEGDNLRAEAYSGWWGCLDLLPQFAQSIRAAAITRHPCTWVHSCLLWGALYGPLDLAGLLGARSHKRVRGRASRIDALADEYCRIYGRLLETERAAAVPMRRFRYEALFSRPEALRTMVDFLRRHRECEFPLQSEPTLNNPANQSRSRKRGQHLCEPEINRVWRRCQQVAQRLGYEPPTTDLSDSHFR